MGTGQGVGARSSGNCIVRGWWFVAALRRHKVQYIGKKRFEIKTSFTVDLRIGHFPQTVWFFTGAEI
jgi:hypothetical protein